MSYYKIIDGVKYDRKMLEVAETALAVHPGNDLEVFDAVPIWEAAVDGGTITETEQRTLDYLRQSYKWTEAAKAWLDRRLSPRNSKEFEKKIQEILTHKYKITSIQWIIDESEAELQSNSFEGKIDFFKALDKIFHSYLEDLKTASGSVKQSVQEVHQLFPDTFPSKRAWSEALERQLRIYLEDAYLYLVRYAPQLNEGNVETFEFTYAPPPGRESLSENWIFGLSLPTFSDHIFWGLVDRSGKTPAFHYEFN